MNENATKSMISILNSLAQDLLPTATIYTPLISARSGRDRYLIRTRGELWTPKVPWDSWPPSFVVDSKKDKIKIIQDTT